jgi:hypothetical protein
MPDESSSDLREFFGWRKVSVQSRVDSRNSPNLHATKEFESYNRKIFLCCLIFLVLVLAPHHQSQHHHGDPYFIDSSIVLLFLVRTLVRTNVLLLLLLSKYSHIIFDITPLHQKPLLGYLFLPRSPTWIKPFHSKTMDEN